MGLLHYALKLQMIFNTVKKEKKTAQNKMKNNKKDVLHVPNNSLRF